MAAVQPCSSAGAPADSRLSAPRMAEQEGEQPPESMAEEGEPPVGAGEDAQAYAAEQGGPITKLSDAQVQMGGGGGWELVRIILRGSTLTMVERDDGAHPGEEVCTADVGDCNCRLPKSGRKGHPHCFRVDLAGKDDHGQSKYICSVASARLATEWMTSIKYCLDESVAANPLSPEIRKTVRAHAVGSTAQPAREPNLHDAAAAAAAALDRSRRTPYSPLHRTPCAPLHAAAPAISGWLTNRSPQVPGGAPCRYRCLNLISCRPISRAAARR
jgi:hypothetical protein